jgi:hypothetical protein
LPSFRVAAGDDRDEVPRSVPEAGPGANAAPRPGREVRSQGGPLPESHGSESHGSESHGSESHGSESHASEAQGSVGATTAFVKSPPRRPSANSRRLPSVESAMFANAS